MTPSTFSAFETLASSFVLSAFVLPSKHTKLFKFLLLPHDSECGFQYIYSFLSMCLICATSENTVRLFSIISQLARNHGPVYGILKAPDGFTRLLSFSINAPFVAHTQPVKPLLATVIAHEIFCLLYVNLQSSTSIPHPISHSFTTSSQADTPRRKQPTAF